jgi:hypothetical protein
MKRPICNGIIELLLEKTAGGYHPGYDPSRVYPIVHRRIKPCKEQLAQPYKNIT